MKTQTSKDAHILTPAAFTFSMLAHLQLHADRHVWTSDTHSLSLSQSHCLSVCCGPLFSFLLFKRGCVPCSRHLPIPPLAYATLHLQGIKSEPSESTEKKDKKIGPNENQKHRLSLLLSFSLLLLLSLPLLPWTWKDERGGELNLIQTSSPQRQMTGLWSVSVRVWVFRSLILSLLSRSQLFLWTERESLEALQFNHLLTDMMSTAPSKGQDLYFLLKWASPGPLQWVWISLIVLAHGLDAFWPFDT